MQSLLYFRPSIKLAEEALSDADERGYKKIVFVHQFLLHNHELGIKSKGGEKIIFPDHAKKIRDMLEKYKVNAVISGHIERLFCEKIDSVNYFSSPGFFKSKENGILWLDSFSEITLNKEDGSVGISFYYKKEANEDYEIIEIPSEEFEKIEK